MSERGKIKLVIGKGQLGMSSVSLYNARKIGGALSTEASAHTLSYMLRKIERPDLLGGEYCLHDEVYDG
jgi:hypothetical protein